MQHSLRKETQRYPKDILLVIAGTILLALTANAALSLTAPKAYATCSGHCYGSVVWPGGVIGGDAQIRYESLSAINYPDHISDEIWLIDTSHTCDPNHEHGVTSSWVEAGIALNYNTGTDYFYWGDCRAGVNDHGLSNNHFVTGATQLNKFWDFIITHTTGTQWQVYQTDPNNGSTVWSAYSQPNSMAPNNIQMGVETTNTSDTSGDGEYIKSRYRTSSGWHYQTNPGTFPPGSNANPPSFQWSTQPSTSYPGGDGLSYCC